MTDHKIHTISVQELKKRRDTDPKLCLIDVREDHEWQAQRIPGALHIPKDNLTATIATTVPKHTQPIYLHCHAGVRSLYAAHCLLELGYKEVYSIDGGIAAWEKAGYAIE